MESLLYPVLMEGTKMLILSRKANQTIVMEVNGVEIEVKITKIKGNVVQVGINAPEKVRIKRGELPPETKVA